MGKADYAKKPDVYFTGERGDYVAQLPPNAHVLEIGCASGNTGAAALAAGAASYRAVELEGAAAARAAQHLTEVIVGDVETLGLPWPPHSFDVLIASEVLEHLVDPWSVLRKIKPLLKPGGLVFASSPNVANWRILRMQLAGDWRRDPEGPMDATHLRWFTPKTYAQMFNDCGYVVDSIEPITPLSRKQRVFAQLTRSPYLFWVQTNLRAHVPV
jgi:2-polyprenyl-3-methyl-5-hydroxy-6-metoxy-1,4-benzoquinol methylase